MSIEKTKPHLPENSVPKSGQRSVPPPPPSARPLDQRPSSVIPSPLPPPISSRLPLPAPNLQKTPTFSATPVAPQILQLEEETSSLRKRLAAQRIETRTEQKNNELLRNEIARLKTQVGRTETSTVARADVQLLRDEHLREQNELKATHRANEARLREEHGAALREVKQQAEREISELQKLVDDLELSRSHAPEAPPADDLTRLKGIGPAFARALVEAGVSTFAQIAAWTDEDIERLAPLIRTTPARIKKNNWPDAARALL